MYPNSESSVRKPWMITRMLSGFWRFLSGIRTVFLNLITLVILIAILVGIFGNPQIEIPDKAPLLLSPSGDLVDQLSYLSPGTQLMGGGPSETLLKELIDTLDQARDDPQITGLLLRLDDLSGGGMSKIQELGKAIDRFRATGKPVVAFADNYTQQQYLLASYADEIYLHDMGGIALMGMGVYRNYFKEALDKLSVNFHIFKVGEFKDFVEPFIRNDMSADSRHQNQEWLNSLWASYSQQIEQRRKLPAGSLTEFINQMHAHLNAVDKDTAQLALQHGLVDKVASRQVRRQNLKERFGVMPDDADVVLHVSDADYRMTHPVKPLDQHEKVALIVAAGTISDGEQPEGSIGGDTLSQLIRKARQDEKVKALVLRVDSGGGSAFASEIIRQELEYTRAQGIPVVVSMGSVAASGGYWIAMAADQVWATPTTITGSIGVFGLFPTVVDSLNKLGIHTDGMGTTKLASSLRPDVPLPNEAAQIFQLGVENIYGKFLQIVSASRHKTSEEVDRIAQGRVWTGAKALELGLVDQSGYLEDAIASAAALAKIPSFKVELIERELTTEEQLLKQLLNDKHIQSIFAGWPNPLYSLLIKTKGMVEQQLPFLTVQKSNIYAWCAGCVAP
jgi:protease IV